MGKEYKRLCFTDNFMFCKVISSNPELCRHMLELILGKKIREVRIKATEKVMEITQGAKSIRLDVYLDDVEGTVYDLEMQTTVKRNMPRRLRYYQGVVDLNLIEKGEDYDALPETVIIFICTFDYFDEGLPFYVFQNRCEAMPELLLGDDTKKIFVNPYGIREGLPDEVSRLLDYIKDNRVTDEFTKELDDAVAKARDHKEWEVEYMYWRAYEMDLNIDKRIAREEGREEGMAEGRAREIVEMGLELGLSEDDILNKLQSKLEISLQAAQEYLKMFGNF